MTRMPKEKKELAVDRQFVTLSEKGSLVELRGGRAVESLKEERNLDDISGRGENVELNKRCWFRVSEENNWMVDVFLLLFVFLLIKELMISTVFFSSPDQTPDLYTAVIFLYTEPLVSGLI